MLQGVIPTYLAVRWIAYSFRYMQAQECMHNFVRLHVTPADRQPVILFCMLVNHPVHILVIFAKFEVNWFSSFRKILHADFENMVPRKSLKV